MQYCFIWIKIMLTGESTRSFGFCDESVMCTIIVMNYKGIEGKVAGCWRLGAKRHGQGLSTIDFPRVVHN